MRVIYVRYRRLLITNGIIIGVLLFLYFFMHSNVPLTVFNVMMGNPIYKGSENQSKVAFECNVVWGTEYVPQMLHIFKEKGVKVTFFIGGSWAKDNPELLMQMVDEGHELGNHGYHHKMHSKISREENKREILETEQIIQQTTGIRTRLFAPPSGDFNQDTIEVARSLGYKTILWSIDTIDWKREGRDIILKRVFRNPHNGAFILMHPTKYTVEALPEMIDGLRSRGYNIVTVGELLEKD